MPTVAAIVITKEEERNIAACLDSIRWVDQIIVVDSGSADTTAAIARKYTENVFIHTWEGYGAAKNFALSQTTTDWVFWIDADERGTVELQQEIQKALTLADPAIVAFSMPRKANFLGHWINHCGWYPGRVIRLFRRTGGSFSADKVHEHLVINGKVKELKSDLLHYTDPNLYHYFEKYNRYTSLAAEEALKRGKKSYLLKLILDPCWMFLKMYIVRFGFLDGRAGLILSVLSANYVFTKYAKLWELEQQGGLDGRE